VANSGSTLAAFETSTSTTFQIIDSLFTGNSAQSNTIMLTYADGSIDGCIFSNNVASIYTQNIFVSFSTITVTDSAFSDTTYSNAAATAASKLTNGAFFYINLSVNLVVTSCSFTGGVAQKGGAFFISGLSVIKVYDSSFTGNYAQLQGGAVYGTGYEYLLFSGSSFENNIAVEGGSELYALYSDYNVTFTSVSVKNPWKTTAFYIDSSSFYADGTHVTANSGEATKGGTLQCINCPNIGITSSSFTN